MKILKPYSIKSMEVKNRLVMPPMCMYSADETGTVSEFHLNHYTTRAMGGVGMIIVEATGVSPIGRISDEDLGLWNDEQIEGHRKLVDAMHAYNVKTAIQINHAGRKYTGSAGTLVAPSAIALSEKHQTPKELSKDEIRAIIQSFADAAKRADAAGYDAIELHGAHGYLIHQFLSALTNKRTDEYGGSLEKRVRFLGEILDAVHSVWPAEKPVLLRISATDYTEGGITPEEMVKIINLVKKRIDLVHVSSGGLLGALISLYPGYQIGFAQTIKEQCEIPTIAVGLIPDLNMAEEIVSNDRSDLVAFGRKLLREPLFILNEAHSRGIETEIPKQYQRAFPR